MHRALSALELEPHVLVLRLCTAVISVIRIFLLHPDPNVLRCRYLHSLRCYYNMVICLHATLALSIMLLSS